ncbi:MAG: sugar transferase [Bacteroidales bacterium]|nr:sugar transferase [Bacteroidales bacterium]
MYRRFIKRFIDVFAAFAGLVILSPVFLIVSLLLYITNNGSAYFLQQRPGKNASIFLLIKFKTMNENRDESGLLADDERLTKIGRFIRSISLDELPQLINILKGDMSLVGPRPLLIKYLPKYSKEQARRHEVRPGLTGWAQVNGRNALSWNAKFMYDNYYVDHLSFLLDLKILLLTVKKVITREGISSENNVTMEEFLG